MICKVDSHHFRRTNFLGGGTSNSQDKHKFKQHYKCSTWLSGFNPLVLSQETTSDHRFLSLCARTFFLSADPRFTQSCSFPSQTAISPSDTSPSRNETEVGRDRKRERETGSMKYEERRANIGGGWVINQKMRSTSSNDQNKPLSCSVAELSVAAVLKPCPDPDIHYHQTRIYDCNAVDRFGKKEAGTGEHSNTFNNQITKHNRKAAAPRGRLPHTKHKVKSRPGPLSSSNVVTPPFIPSGAPPWDSRPVSGAGVVHYHSLHRPRSVPTALGPAPLVTYPHRPSQAGGYSRDCALLPPSPLSRGGEPVRAAAAYLGVRTDEARERRRKDEE